MPDVSGREEVTSGTGMRAGAMRAGAMRAGVRQAAVTQANVLLANVGHAVRVKGDGDGKPAISAAPERWTDRHLLLDHISEAIYAADKVYRITDWTSSAERLFGYSAIEAIGRPLSELLYPPLQALGGKRETLLSLEAGRSWRGSGPVRLRDGSEIWLDSAVEPIMADGRFAGSVWVSRDATEAHEARQKSIDEERFVEAVFDVVGALVLVLDPQGRVMRFNAACERLSGFTQEEVAGRAIWDVVIPPDEVADVQSAVAALNAGAFPNSHENHWLTRTGKPLLIRWDNTCVVDERGVVTHVIATGSDITEARRTHDEVRALETIGQLIAEQGAVPEAFGAVLDEMQKRMGYRFLSLYLSGTPSLRLLAQRGYPVLPEFLDAGRGVVGRVYRAGLGELVADVKRDPDYLPVDEAAVSEIAVPLLGDGMTLGVLNVEAQPPAVLGEGDLQFARTVAERLSGALLRDLAEEALVERVRLLTALAEFAVAVNAVRDPERLGAVLADAVGAVLRSDAVVITILDRKDGRNRVRAVRGLSEDAVGVVIEPGDGTLGRVIRERCLIVTDRLPRAEYSAALRDHMPFDAIRAMVVPLLGGDEVLGLITVGRAEPDLAFTRAEYEVFGLLGSHAALALANANLVEDVSALAIRDALTGLYNRRHFDVALDLAVARFKRHAPAGSLAAIMFDLDHFGEFNARYGHLSGDALLRAFAEILRNRLRSADIVARYGGEEFVVILEDCGLPQAKRLADEVRSELEATSVEGTDARWARATVSAGCAVLYATEPTKEALLSRADIGLYKAKEAGRNRVVAV